jgi:hypothetical protein
MVARKVRPQRTGIDESETPGGDHPISAQTINHWLFPHD